MWSMALLINTSTWLEFKRNWKLICIVLLQLHICNGHINRENYDALLSKIKNIKSGKNIFEAVKASESGRNHDRTTLHSDPYNFDDEESEEFDDDPLVRGKKISSSTKQ